MTTLTIRTQADADAKIPDFLRGKGPFHLRVEPMEGAIDLDAVWDAFQREEYDIMPFTWEGKINECPNCEAGENCEDSGGDGSTRVRRGRIEAISRRITRIFGLGKLVQEGRNE